MESFPSEINSPYIPEPIDDTFDDPLSFNPAEFADADLMYDTDSQQWGFIDPNSGEPTPIPELPPLDPQTAALYPTQPAEQQKQTLKSALESIINDHNEAVLDYQNQIANLPVAAFAPIQPGYQKYQDIALAKPFIMAQQQLSSRSQYKQLKGILVIPASFITRIRSGDGNHQISTPCIFCEPGSEIEQTFAPFFSE